MQRPAADLPGTAVDLLADVALPADERQYRGQDDAGGNRGALEVRHLATALREGFGRDVETREPAHAAADEVDQHGDVPATVHARRERERCRRDAEGDHVRQRIELAAERRMGVSCARDAAVEHVEQEGERRHRGCQVEVPHVQTRRVAHAKKDRGHAAGGIAERQEIRKVKTADHCEVLAIRHARAVGAGDIRLGQLLRCSAR
jgi:hypothetical protein